MGSSCWWVAECVCARSHAEADGHAMPQVGLFAYDVFWVFGTDVMVTVARSFDAPIKLLFLRAHATEDTDAQFSMLGLGDIVIPGTFRSLLYRCALFSTNMMTSATRHFHCLVAALRSQPSKCAPWAPH